MICNLIMTDYGPVRISERTNAVMSAQFPGWDDPLINGAYQKRAARGRECLVAVATAIAALASEAGQELVEL